MDTRTYLNQVNRMNFIINNKLEEIAQIDEMIHGTGAINYDKINVQTSSDKDVVGKSVAMLMDMIDENNCLIEKYLQRKKIISAQISNMPNDYRYNILYKKFILGESNEKIANDIPCSLSTAKSSIKRAMSDFEKMYGEMYLDEKFDLYFKVEPQSIH